MKEMTSLVFNSHRQTVSVPGDCRPVEDKVTLEHRLFICLGRKESREEIRPLAEGLCQRLLEGSRDPMSGSAKLSSLLRASGKGPYWMSY